LAKEVIKKYFLQRTRVSVRLNWFILNGMVYDRTFWNRINSSPIVSIRLRVFLCRFVDHTIVAYINVRERFICIFQAYRRTNFVIADLSVLEMY